MNTRTGLWQSIVDMLLVGTSRLLDQSYVPHARIGDAVKHRLLDVVEAVSPHKSSIDTYEGSRCHQNISVLPCQSLPDIARLA